MKTINCSVCGVLVSVSKFGKHTKYCAGCRDTVKKENDRANRKHYYLLAKRKRKKSNMDEIEKLNSEALKQDISYGKYVAGLFKDKGGW